MIALQLYTVRTLLEDVESAKRTLRRIKEIGYEGVQLACAVSEVRKLSALASDIGLTVIGHLGGVADIEKEATVLFSALKEVGACDIGVSGYETTKKGALAFASRLGAVATQVKEAGFRFSYHNHSHEFLRTECGKTVMDIYLETLAPSLFDLMPDTYWLQNAGIDVRDFIEKNATRIKILHLKDMRYAESGAVFAPIGEGNINMKGITRLAKSLGIDTFVVEQDICDGDPLICIEKSYAHLTKMLEE